MAVQDRRSGKERRGNDRYPAYLDIEWQGTGERKTGRISDVSDDGCFVLSSGDVADGEDVRLFIPLDNGMKVQFEGKVANHVFEIGFGVKFEQLNAAQREVLAKIDQQSESA